MTKTYFPFNAELRSPSKTPPAGACDSQFHVFGPSEKYPVRNGSAYEMPTATFDRARKLHRSLGIERGVIVQSTTYGTDHTALLDALAEAGENYKGCAIVNDDVSESYLAELHNSGVGGARFNFLKKLNMFPSTEVFHRTIERISDYGWYAKIQPGPEGILEHAHLLRNLKIPVVIDHLGRTPVGSNESKDNVSLILSLLEKGNFWVMLSNGHKLSQAGYPWDDVVPLARGFIEAAPERVIWASDWPHPLSSAPVPKDADLLELLYRYTEDEDVLRKILVENPIRLFGFNKTSDK